MDERSISLNELYELVKEVNPEILNKPISIVYDCEDHYYSFNKEISKDDIDINEYGIEMWIVD